MNGLAELRARHGSSWQIRVDARSGHAEMIFGGAVEAEVRPVTDADFFRVARERLAELQEMHGVDADTLVDQRALFLPLGRSGATTDKMTVRFAQVVGGVPVDGGFVNVLFDVDGRMLSLQTTALTGALDVATAPVLSRDEGIAVARRAFEAETSLPSTDVREASLVILGVERGERFVPRLAWKLFVGWNDDAGVVPVGRELWIDALDGGVLQSLDGVHTFDVSGTVSTNASPGVLPDIASNPPAAEAMPHVTLTSNQGSTSADANGNFNFSGPTSVSNVNVSYLGSFANVNNNSGADYSLPVGALSGSGNSVLLNPSPSEALTAQANAYTRITAFRTWVRAVNPLDSSMDFQAVGNVNISASCNATYSGNATNFYHAASGCVNTAYSTVIAHEMGHWANSVYGSGNASSGMGEGNADVWAMYQYDTAIVGANFSGGGYIRSGNNTTPFCGDGCQGCYGESHANGEPWMGAAWKVRTRLKNALGNAAGGDHADGIFLGWMNAYNQTTITTAIETQWLTLDDDDANLSNGTPNFASIDGGFRQQGWPGFSLFDFTALTQVPDTEDQVGPYTVDVTFTPPSGTPTATLFYSVNDGAFTGVSMSSIGGNTFRAQIPGQVSISKVEYYVEANSDGFVDTFPAGGASNPTFFFVAHKELTFDDDFEALTNWTVSDTNLTGGSWVRVDPNGTTNGGVPAAPSDDASPDGTLCYVTGQGAVGGAAGAADVDGGPTTLTSPVIQLGGQDAVIEFSYWFYNDDGDDVLEVKIARTGQASSLYADVAQLSGGVGGVCSGPSPGGGTWRTYRLRVKDYIQPQGATRLRLVVADNPNNSITEAGLDEVIAHKLFPVTNPCGNVVRYCSPASPNQTGSPAVLNVTGTTSVAANDTVFTVAPLATGNNGLIAYSPDQASTPLGNGTLCLGTQTLGFVVRLPGAAPDALGVMTSALDIASPPFPVAQITAGSTWNFQAWNRDFTPGGAGFNFSDALSITFCP